MTETFLQLNFNRLQCQQWYAQTLTYMYSLVFKPNTPKEQAIMDTIKGIGSQLCGLCTQNSPSLPLPLTLDAEEIEAVVQMFAFLQEVYEEYPHAEHYCMALEHLAACRALIQQAEQAQHASNGTQEVPLRFLP